MTVQSVTFVIASVTAITCLNGLLGYALEEHLERQKGAAALYQLWCLTSGFIVATLLLWGLASGGGAS